MRIRPAKQPLRAKSDSLVKLYEFVAFFGINCLTYSAIGFSIQGLFR